MGLGIVFSGQGNQRPDMFKMLAHDPRASQELNALAYLVGCSLLPEISLNNQALFHNRNAQPLIAGLGYLQWQLLQHDLPSPLAVAGYSLGELTAYAAAGACDFASLIRLAQQRATVMDEAALQSDANSLLAVSGINQSQLMTGCVNNSCFPAIQNSAENWVVGGTNINLTKLSQSLLKLEPNLKLNQLKVDVASHTPLLSSAVAKFRQLLLTENLSEINFPVIASISATTIYSLNDGLELLARQIGETIHFSQTIQIMHELGATVILELGAGNALSRIIAGLDLGIEIRSINDFKTFSGVINWVNRYLER